MLIQNLINYTLGKKRFQSFFAYMYATSMRGMNFYNVVLPKFSGEDKLVHKLMKERTLNEAFLLIDIGAHRGEYLELFMNVKQSRNKLEVHAFEPQVDCADFIINKFQNEVSKLVVNKCAVGYGNMDVELFISEENDLLATTFPFPFENFISKLSSKVRVQKTNKINICDYVYRNINEERKIDLIKVDVEGDELEVLESMLELYKAKKIRTIQFEYCFVNMYRKSMFYDFWKILSPFYIFYRVLLDGLDEIKEYNVSFEQGAPVNYFLILKDL